MKVFASSLLVEDNPQTYPGVFGASDAMRIEEGWDGIGLLDGCRFI
jgi:hypothetical protein